MVTRQLAAALQRRQGRAEALARHDLHAARQDGGGGEAAPRVDAPVVTLGQRRALNDGLVAGSHAQVFEQEGVGHLPARRGGQGAAEGSGGVRAARGGACTHACASASVGAGLPPSACCSCHPLLPPMHEDMRIRAAPHPNCTFPACRALTCGLVRFGSPVGMPGGTRRDMVASCAGQGAGGAERGCVVDGQRWNQPDETATAAAAPAAARDLGRAPWRT